VNFYHTSDSCIIRFNSVITIPLTETWKLKIVGAHKNTEYTTKHITSATKCC